MKTAVFIDTSYFLALVNSRDKYHHAAAEAARQSVPPFVTTTAVLIELGNALAKPPARTLGIRALQQIRADTDITIVSITPQLFLEAVHLYQERNDKEWGLTDCTSFVVMQQLKLTNVLTADRHFTQAGFNRLLPSL